MGEKQINRQKEQQKTRFFSPRGFCCRGFNGRFRHAAPFTAPLLEEQKNSETEICSFSYLLKRIISFGKSRCHVFISRKICVLFIFAIEIFTLYPNSWISSIIIVNGTFKKLSNYLLHWKYKCVIYNNCIFIKVTISLNLRSSNFLAHDNF